MLIGGDVGIGSTAGRGIGSTAGRVTGFCAGCSGATGAVASAEEESTSSFFTINKMDLVFEIIDSIARNIPDDNHFAFASRCRMD